MSRLAPCGIPTRKTVLGLNGVGLLGLDGVDTLGNTLLGIHLHGRHISKAFLPLSSLRLHDGSLKNTLTLEKDDFGCGGLSNLILQPSILLHKISIITRTIRGRDAR